jgi:hypothetical protein
MNILFMIFETIGTVMKIGWPHEFFVVTEVVQCSKVNLNVLVHSKCINTYHIKTLSIHGLLVSEYSAFKWYDKDLILAAFKDSEVMYEGNGLVT